MGFDIFDILLFVLVVMRISNISCVIWYESILYMDMIISRFGKFDFRNENIFFYDLIILLIFEDVCEWWCFGRLGERYIWCYWCLNLFLVVYLVYIVGIVG